MGERRALRFSRMMNASPLIWKFVPKHIFFTLFVEVFILVFCAQFFWGFTGIEIPLNPKIALGFGILVFDLMVRGDEPWRFDSQFFTGSHFWRSNAPFMPTMKELTPKKRISSVRHNGRKYKAVENEHEIVCPLRIRLDPTKEIGGRLLRKGDSYQITFTWKVNPFPSSITEREAISTTKKVRDGLRGLNLGESLTFTAGAWRYAPIETPLPQNQSVQSLIAWKTQYEREVVQAARGLRIERSIYVTGTYTVGSAGVKPEDSAEYWLQFFSEVLSGLMGGSNISDWSGVRQALKGASDAWRSLNSLLFKQMGLTVHPLTFDELWHYDYRAFNQGAVPQCPYWIRVNEQGKSKLIIRDESNYRSVLFRGGAPDESKKDSVYLPGRELYVGVAALSPTKNMLPMVEFENEHGADELRKLFFGSSVIADAMSPDASGMGSDVWDTEYIVQYTGINQNEVRVKMRDLEDEEQMKSRIEQDTRKESSVTQHRRGLVGSDRISLFEGAFGIEYSVMALIYRSNLRDLKRATLSFCDLAATKTYWAREKEYAPSYWRRAQTFTTKKIGVGPLAYWKRTYWDFTPMAASWMPLIADTTQETKGVPYFSVYGNTPVWVNPYPDKGVKGIITIAPKGSGKSVKETGNLLYGYQQGIRQIVLDATATTIATFKPVMDALDGGYFNSREDYFNLLQGTDFRKLQNDSEKLEFARGLLQDQWANAVTDILMGERRDVNLRADYLSISRALFKEWIDDPEIKRAYDKAYDGGFNSSAWKEIFPTLRQFLEFAQCDRLPPSARRAERFRVLLDPDTGQYRGDLDMFLASPAGMRISCPSNFDVDRPIVVCALGNIQEARDSDVVPLIASVLGLSSAAALRFAKIGITGDEASICCKFATYRSAFGYYGSGGRKAGISWRMIGQSYPQIKNHEDSELYISNADVFEVGRVSTTDADYLSSPEGKNIPRSVLSLVDERSYRPPLTEASSRWGMLTEGQHYVVDYKPSWFQLAISVNSPGENAERDQVLEQHDDKMAGYIAYSHLLKVRSVEKNISVKEFLEICPKR
jgi:hypothetical protein